MLPLSPPGLLRAPPQLPMPETQLSSGLLLRGRAAFGGQGAQFQVQPVAPILPERPLQFPGKTLVAPNVRSIQVLRVAECAVQSNAREGRVQTAECLPSAGRHNCPIRSAVFLAPILRSANLELPSWLKALTRSLCNVDG